MLQSAGLASKAIATPKWHPCNGCWKQLFKIQQPLCLTTHSDLWYFLPKQFICLAQQLINSQGHPSQGLARAGPAAGPDGGCVSGINTILIDYTASDGLPNEGCLLCTMSLNRAPLATGVILKCYRKAWKSLPGKGFYSIFRDGKSVKHSLGRPPCQAVDVIPKLAC